MGVEKIASLGKIGFEKFLKDAPAAKEIASKEFENVFAKNVKNIDKDTFKKLADYKISELPCMPKISPLEKLMEILPKTKGAKGSVTLTGDQLKFIHLPGKSQEALSAFLKRARNPEVTLSFKSAKKGSGYSIAALKVMDGKSVVGTGAISMTKPGAADNIVKARLSLGRKSKAVYANGFVDASKPVNAATDDVILATTRKAGEYNIKSRVGDSLGWNLHVAPENKEFSRVASYTGESKQVKNLLNQMAIKAGAASDKVNTMMQKFVSGKI